MSYGDLFGFIDETPARSRPTHELTVSREEPKREPAKADRVEPAKPAKAEPPRAVDDDEEPDYLGQVYGNLWASTEAVVVKGGKGSSDLPCGDCIAEAARVMSGG